MVGVLATNTYLTKENRVEKLAEAIVFGISKTYAKPSEKVDGIINDLYDAVAGLRGEIEEMQEAGFKESGILARRVERMMEIRKFARSLKYVALKYETEKMGY